MKINKQNKNLYLLMPVISILVIIGLGLFLIQPKITTIMEKQSSIKAEESKKELLTTKITKLDDFNIRKTELLADLTAINIALPTQKDVPNLIIQIQKTAEESDVEIQSIQLTPGKLLDEKGLPTKTGPELSINLSLKGNYDAILTFLGKVYKGKRLINLESINVTSSGTSESDSDLTAAIIMSSYFQPLPAKPVDETDEVPVLSEADKKTYDTIKGYETVLTDNGTTIPLRTPAPTPTSDATASAAPAVTAN